MNYFARCNNKRKLITLAKSTYLLVSLIFIAININAQVHVRGYYRSNGTYVAPHYRSSPDGNPYNNYSYPGNTNPYTGKVAGGNPDTYLNNYYNRRSPSPPNQGYSPSTYPTPPTPTYSTPTYPTPSYPTPSYSTPSYPTPSYSSPTQSGSNYTTQDRSTISPENTTVSGNKALLNSLLYTVTASELNVRTSPSTQSDILYVLNYDHKVLIISIENFPWCKIIFYYKTDITESDKIGTGYVHSAYLSPINMAPAFDDAASTPGSATYSDPDTDTESAYSEVPYKTYVKKMGFSPPLRNSPGINYPAIYQCPEGSLVVVYQRGDIYHLVQVNGITGYISKSVLVSP